MKGYITKKILEIISVKEEQIDDEIQKNYKD